MGGEGSLSAAWDQQIAGCDLTDHLPQLVRVMGCPVQNSVEIAEVQVVTPGSKAQAKGLPTHSPDATEIHRLLALVVHCGSAGLQEGQHLGRGRLGAQEHQRTIESLQLGKRGLGQFAEGVIGLMDGGDQGHLTLGLSSGGLHVTGSQFSAPAGFVPLLLALAKSKGVTGNPAGWWLDCKSSRSKKEHFCRPIVLLALDLEPERICRQALAYN
jgi:hypothetical protein